MRTAKTLIRLGWSESSLGAQIVLLVLSCSSSVENNYLTALTLVKMYVANSYVEYMWSFRCLSIIFHQQQLPFQHPINITKWSCNMSCLMTKPTKWHVRPDQPGHPPSLIRVLAVRMKKAEVIGYPLSAQQRLWSDWADAQADLSLCWARSHFVGFVMRRLIQINSKFIPVRWSQLTS